jgi:hypothetical protein
VEGLSPLEVGQGWVAPHAGPRSESGELERRRCNSFGVGHLVGSIVRKFGTRDCHPRWEECWGASGERGNAWTTFEAGLASSTKLSIWKGTVVGGGVGVPAGAGGRGGGSMGRTTVAQGGATTVARARGRAVNELWLQFWLRCKEWLIRDQRVV